MAVAALARHGTEVTGKDGGPVKVDTKTQHVFQPSKEVWDEVLRERAEYERLRDGDTDEDTDGDVGSYR